MALWNSNINWSTGILWGPSALPSGSSDANSQKDPLCEQDAAE